MLCRVTGHLRSLIFAVPPLAAAGIVAALVLFGRISALLGDPPELYIADVWVALAFPLVGVWLLAKESGQRVGYVFLGTGALAIVALGTGWATFDALDGDLRAPGVALAWLASWMWTPYLLVPTLVPVLHVDPRLQGRWTRIVALTTLGVVAVATVSSAFAPGPISETSDVINPLGVRGAEWLQALSGASAAVTFLILTPAGIAASAWHVRRARSDGAQGRIVVLATALMLVSVLLADALRYPWNDVVTALALSLVPLGVVISVREARIRRHARLEAERLRRAREEERRRLRRELHDGVGPELAGLRLQLAAASADMPERIRREFDDATDRLAMLAGDVRRLVDGLRPVALEEMGLAEAVRSRCALLSRDGCTVTCTLTEVPACDAAVELAAYQITSEALANAVRHAAATEVGVTLSSTPDGLVIEVRDNGRGGVAPRDGGVGLSSMQLRADEVGGQLRIESASSGTRVHAVLPPGMPA